MITSERIKDVEDDEELYQIISSEMSNLMQDVNFSPVGGAPHPFSMSNRTGNIDNRNGLSM
jgi:hypothetical protein